MAAGPAVDLSAYEGQPLSRDVLRAATATIMADITGLLAQLRGEAPPSSAYDPVAARRAARQAAKDSMQNEPAGRAPEPAANPDPVPDGPGGDEPRKATPA